MKHSDPLVAALTKLCLAAHIGVNTDALIRLVSYLDAVLAANEAMNLTRIADRSQGMRLHVLDSLCALPEIEDAPSGALCDIGTGAGFPGVPLAWVAERKCMLLDSVGKKADVVVRILAELEMSQRILVSRDRAEQHARVRPAAYSIVTARAVAPLASLVELAAPLLSRGGRLVALKGSPLESEVEAGLSAAAVVGLEFTSRRDFVLPGGDERRCVFVYQSVRKSRVPLPRREGMAQHSPLR